MDCKTENFGQKFKLFYIPPWSHGCSCRCSCCGWKCIHVWNVLINSSIIFTSTSMVIVPTRLGRTAVSCMGDYF